jgi:hypothetical protein
VTAASGSQGALQPLDVDTCLDLLAEQEVGRLAFVDHGELVILPVNYLLDRGAVLVRTTEGSKLDAAVRGERVAFEVDAIDPVARSGWSVLVKGRATELWEGGELDQARRLPLQPWAAGEREHFLVVFPSSITGRRLGPAPEHDVGEPWW